MVCSGLHSHIHETGSGKSMSYVATWNPLLWIRSAPSSKPIIVCTQELAVERRITKGIGSITKQNATTSVGLSQN